jgi:hypothetical protein
MEPLVLINRKHPKWPGLQKLVIYECSFDFHISLANFHFPESLEEEVQIALSSLHWQYDIKTKISSLVNSKINVAHFCMAYPLALNEMKIRYHEQPRIAKGSKVYEFFKRTEEIAKQIVDSEFGPYKTPETRNSLKKQACSYFGYFVE